METALGDGTISVIIWEKDGEKEAGSDGSGDITWKPVMSRTGTSDLSDHLATKNVVKKMFYQMLVERTKKELPWGSLTGYPSHQDRPYKAGGGLEGTGYPLLYEGDLYGQ